MPLAGKVTGVISRLSKVLRVLVFSVPVLSGWSGGVFAAGDLPCKFSGLGTILNTRHNLTFDPIGGGNVNMDPYRNEYGEVCIYCHTPHGASGQIQAPLWNRTASSATYTTYDTLNTSSLDGTVTAPGAASLTCLSCHDGTVAIDSIINMTGSGGYNSAQQTSQDDAFLNDSWDNVTINATVHMNMVQCLLCHSADAGFVLGAGATDFRIALIGTNLTDDHPIGINYGADADFNAPTATTGNLSFFDSDGDGHADSNEIRLYDSGDGAEVECASCHDPHGVRSAGAGSSLYPMFLRQANTQSSVCLVCHVK